MLFEVIMARTISQGNQVTFTVITRNALKDRVDADALPSVVNVQVDGVDQNLTTNVTQAQDGTPAPLVGEYHVQVDTSGLVDGNDVSVLVSAAIGGDVQEVLLGATVISTSGGPSISGC